MQGLDRGKEPEVGRDDPRNVAHLIVYRVSLDEQETTLQRQEDDLGGLSAELGAAWQRLKAAATDLSAYVLMGAP